MGLRTFILKSILLPIISEARKTAAEVSPLTPAGRRVLDAFEDFANADFELFEPSAVYAVPVRPGDPFARNPYTPDGPPYGPYGPAGRMSPAPDLGPLRASKGCGCACGSCPRPPTTEEQRREAMMEGYAMGAAQAKTGEKCLCEGDCACGLTVTAFGETRLLRAGDLVVYQPDYGDPVSASVAVSFFAPADRKVGMIRLKFRLPSGAWAEEIAPFDPHGAPHTWHHDVVYACDGCTCTACAARRSMA